MLDQNQLKVILETSHKARWFIVLLSKRFESLSK